VTAAYQTLLGKLRAKGLRDYPSVLPELSLRKSSDKTIIVPAKKRRYLAEIADTIRGYHEKVAQQSEIARERQQLNATAKMLSTAGKQAPSDIQTLIEDRDNNLDTSARVQLEQWPETKTAYQGEHQDITLANGKTIRNELTRKSLSGSLIPRVALPDYQDEGEVLKFLMKENLPGFFPFTAGVFPFKREGEDPARMFAGEGDPFRTNRRFKALSEHSDAKRLSTAFDSVTLYGADPDLRPDIYGKIGNSGVSIATLDDMKALFDGFDLCSPSTSVSMTINGPAPTILAMFFNTAIDQQIDQFNADNGRTPNENDA